MDIVQPSGSEGDCFAVVGEEVGRGPGVETGETEGVLRGSEGCGKAGKVPRMGGGVGGVGGFLASGICRGRVLAEV